MRVGRLSVPCPSMAVSARSRRIEVRVSDHERRLEEAAAAALGLSLSEFVRQAAHGRAREILREQTDVVLDDDAAERFLAAVDDDSPPRPEIRELFQRNLPWEA